MTQAIQNSADQFLTGTGILLQGDPFRGNTTGFNNVPLKDGRVEYYCAVGFPKDQPQATNWDALWAVMNQVANTHKYAASYQQSAWAGFHWKYEDGDAPQNVSKPGWKGCHVIKFKNGFPPNVFDEKGQLVPSPYIDSTDATGKFTQQQKPGAHPFACGHFVRVLCSIKCNESAPPQSGIYINFHMIQRVGYGTEIHSGPDYTSIVNSAPVAQLAGMSTMPTGAAAAPGVSSVPPGAAPATPGAVGGAPITAPPATPGAAPAAPGAAQGMPPTAPPVAAAPAAPGVPPAAPGGAPAAPPVAETPQSRMLVADATYDQYIQQGWTDDLLVQHGKMRPATHAYNA